MDRQRRLWTWAAFGLALGVGSGCGSLTPRNFRDLKNPAPVVRAGAVGLTDGQPDYIAIPALIASLDDANDVVRMNANQILKQRTRQDFGFVPWAEPEARAPAVERWKAWWQSQPRSPTQAPPQGSLATRRRKL